MELVSIPKLSGLTPHEFAESFLNNKRPVVFKDLIKDWPAFQQWDFQFFIKNYGHLTVPVYDPNFSKAGKTYMKASFQMKFGDYLNKILEGPCELRIFLWNILKQAPELVNDIRIPRIMNGFYNEFPFLFFGGQGSYTKIHYDVDCSHVFLSQFRTRKRVLLFSQDQTPLLGQIPFTVGCLVDMNNPDEDKFPGLKYLQGWETTLEHGETLFIPSMYWHHIEYIDPGFSISLRAANSFTQKLKGTVNLARHLAVDRGMNFILGAKWGDLKIDLARKAYSRKQLWHEI
ncbi:MAG: cupin-like domain-containing protein [Saprospiraceae bacterium]|nr:cupin-like domain-containing protein [Saprospiraceae bacterium]